MEIAGARRAGRAPATAEPVQPAALLAEILANLQAGSASAMELIRRTIRRIAADPAELLTCPAREALKLAIWSEKSRIPADEIQKLSPLWSKYFG